MIRAVLFASLLFLTACVTTSEPNVAYQGPYPEKFSIIQQANPLLAQEIGKLPEIQDGISDEDERVLNSIVDLYQESQKQFDNMFAEMQEAGRVETRKFITPLQAFFWIVSDYGKHTSRSVISNYSIGELLKIAWIFSTKPMTAWFRLETNKIAASCIGADICAKVNERNSDVITILSLYREFRSSFSYEFDRSNFEDFAKRFSKQQEKRWREFLTVTDRLNSPELIDIYQRWTFTYRYYVGIGRSDKDVFKTKSANCVDTSVFARNLLRKSGYFAGTVTVKSNDPANHRIAYYKDGGKFFVIDNGRRRKKGIIGPYDGLSDSPYEIVKFRN